MNKIKEAAAKNHAAEAAKIAEKGILINLNDTITCRGIGYPNFKGLSFTVTRGIKVENGIPYVGIKINGCPIAVDIRDFDITPQGEL